MQIEVENSPEVQLAIDRLVEQGRETAMRALMGAGIQVARTTERLNRGLHGPLRWSPSVRRGEDHVRVGYTLLRPRLRAVLQKHLEQARAAEWPRALRGS